MRHALLSMLMLTLLAGAALADSAPATQPATTRPAAWYTLEPEEFFARAEANAPIDPANIDDSLLTAAVFHETNLRRQQHDLPALSHFYALDTAARTHAKAMVEHKFIAHENPHDPELRQPIDRVRKAGLLKPRYVAENIATTFAIQYESGRKVYTDLKRGKKQFSYKSHGEPIPPHTYRTFAAKLLDQWMNSPGHRANILSDQPTLLGAACVPSKSKLGMDQFHCVQVFARR